MWNRGFTQKFLVVSYDVTMKVEGGYYLAPDRIHELSVYGEDDHKLQLFNYSKKNLCGTFRTISYTSKIQIIWAAFSIKFIRDVKLWHIILKILSIMLIECWDFCLGLVEFSKESGRFSVYTMLTVSTDLVSFRSFGIYTYIKRIEWIQNKK